MLRKIRRQYSWEYDICHVSWFLSPSYSHTHLSLISTSLSFFFSCAICDRSVLSSRFFYYFFSSDEGFQDKSLLHCSVLKLSASLLPSFSISLICPIQSEMAIPNSIPRAFETVYVKKFQFYSWFLRSIFVWPSRYSQELAC